MRKHLIWGAAALILGLCSCSRQHAALQFCADDGTKVRLMVAAPEIIRVSAVPKGEDFSNRESLCALPVQDSTKYEVSQTDFGWVISTDKLSVRVEKSDGRVSFFDKEGNMLTGEDARSFGRKTVGTENGWTVRQTFHSPDDEAFYGLGQHQADEWNYKGKNEELFQYNTKISIPFIVSSRHYGILWDSYSFCRWGNPRDYADIGEVFTLYDKYGAEGALTGTYTPAQGSPLVRRETALNQEYLIEPDLLKVKGAPDFKFGGSKVLFEGSIEPKESGTYHFSLYYAGYMKVYLDGVEVMPEIWRTAWNPNSRKFEATLTAGKRVPLRIEWIPDGDVSYCALKALSPVSEEEQGKMSWWGEMQQQLDYYFIYGEGETLDGVLKGYRHLTGKAPIMPAWAMGYWQSRERYSSQEQVVSTLKEFRDRHIPIDNIVQDWQYWEPDQWGSHEFDASRYPDPKAMVDSVHALGGRFMISVWPKFYAGTEHFKEFDDRGWMYRQAIRDSVEDWLGYQQSFYDAYSKGARKLFWNQMEEHLFGLGVDSWWMDASEPNVHDCTNMDYRKALCGPTALGSSTEYFNAYALMNAQAVYEGQRGSGSDKRVFLLTRSGFAGLQRYSTASWSGDIGTRWEDMKAQISAGLNFAMSGIPYWTQDVGGFSVESRYYGAQNEFDATGVENADLKEWRELNTRWHQMGMFNPLYRAHGQYPLREPWNIAPEDHKAYNAITECIRMRYALLPYIYSLNARVHFDDYTIMRPLALNWPSDPTAREISDQFMFGDAIMVCPVYEYGARSKEVYLPEGGWYDLHNGFRYIDGGTGFKANAPYEHIPLYARAGQIVPTGRPVEYSAQEQDGALTIYIFGGGDASFTLYEDDGLTYRYEKGEYSTIPMQWDESSRTFSLGQRLGTFPSMKESRQVCVKFISPEHTDSKTVTYSGTTTEITF